jgi:hypothetical protein
MSNENKSEITLQSPMEDLPLRSDPEAADFTPVDAETAARLRGVLTGIVESGEKSISSPDIADKDAEMSGKWRADIGSRPDGFVLVNFNSWDMHPQAYRPGIKKGEHRRTTIQSRADGTFTYWGIAIPNIPH